MIATNSMLATALAVMLSLATFTTAAPVFGKGANLVFGLPRGGGLFGGKGKEDGAATDV